MNRYFILIVFLLKTLLLSSQVKVVITEDLNNKNFNLEESFSYVIDKDGKYTLSDILSDKSSEILTQSNNDKVFLKPGINSVWYKFVISNKTNTEQNLVLGLSNSEIQKITFFSLSDSSVIKTGADEVFSTRPIQSKNFLFPISIAPTTESIYIIKIGEQKCRTAVSFYMDYGSSFNKKQRWHDGFLGMLFTLEAILILLLVYMFIAERKRAIIYLLISLILLFLVGLWNEGTLHIFLWPNSPNFNIVFGRILYFIQIPFLLLFVLTYLELSSPKNGLGIIIKILIWISFGYLLFHLLYLNCDVHRFVAIVLIPSSIFLSLWGIIASRHKKINFFRHLSVTVILLMLNVLLDYFFNIGVKYYSFSHRYTKYVNILFLFVVGIDAFLKKFIRTYRESILLNENLEKQVEKRTNQLNLQKEELQSQQEELLQQQEKIQEKKEILELKNVELEKLSLVASKTDNLVYIFEPDGTLTWFNKSFTNILGFSLDEYQSGEPVNVVDISTNENIRHVLNTCLREKVAVSYESHHTDKDDKVTWFHTTLTPILDEDEDVKRIVAIDTDITKQKEYEKELNLKKDDAENQKKLAMQRKEELEVRQVEVTDSIRYAKRIQSAIMPKIKQVHRDFPDSFVLFLPKDIVSGDFYWYHRIEDKYFIIAVDCTGHGVPGAFMSIIGNYLLNTIIIYNRITDPAEILKHLNRKIKISLKSDGRTSTSDGMDISVAVVDKSKKTIEISSALRPVYLFLQNDFVEVKGDKIPITSNISGMSLSSFKKHTFEFKDGDKFYMFSDGIIDQFGGKGNKKFLIKRFKQLLFEIYPLTMREQKDIIRKAFDEWRGVNEQVDDVLVMGIKFTEDSNKLTQ